MVERLRGRAGDEQRMRRLKAHGVTCSRCGCLGAWREREASRLLPLLVVDHIVPLTRGGSDDDSNTRVVCKPCHDAVTAEQFGHREAVKGRGVGRDGRPTDRSHPWNRSVR